MHMEGKIPLRKLDKIRNPTLEGDEGAFRVIVVKCPKCGKLQNYRPHSRSPVGKTKACVFCGSNFLVYRDEKTCNRVVYGNSDKRPNP